MKTGIGISKEDSKDQSIITFVVITDGCVVESQSLTMNGDFIEVNLFYKKMIENLKQKYGCEVYEEKDLQNKPKELTNRFNGFEESYFVVEPNPKLIKDFESLTWRTDQ